MTFPGSLYAMAELFKLLFKPGEGNKRKQKKIISKIKILLWIDSFWKNISFNCFSPSKKNDIDNVAALLCYKLDMTLISR